MQNIDFINSILKNKKINFNVGDFVIDKRLLRTDEYEEKMGIKKSVFKVESFGIDSSRRNELIVIVIDSSDNKITFDAAHLERIK